MIGSDTIAGTLTPWILLRAVHTCPEKLLFQNIVVTLISLRELNPHKQDGREIYGDVRRRLSDCGQVVL